MVTAVETYLRDVRKFGCNGSWWLVWNEVRFGFWHNGEFVEYRASGQFGVARYVNFSCDSKMMTHRWAVDKNQVQRYYKVKSQVEDVVWNRK